LASPIHPRLKGDPVSSNISQNWPNLSIWKPLTEASIPSQNER